MRGMSGTTRGVPDNERRHRNDESPTRDVRANGVSWSGGPDAMYDKPEENTYRSASSHSTTVFLVSPVVACNNNKTNTYRDPLCVWAHIVNALLYDASTVRSREMNPGGSNSCLHLGLSAE